MSGPAKSSPKDAQVMSAILKDMGVLESEPRLVNQMLEFTYRYVTDVLEDAKVYSNHANRKNIDTDDVKLAVQMKMDHSFTSPPPRDLLLEIARQKNSQPLPLVKPYSGPSLPPDRYCLSQPNYKLKATKKPRSTPFSLSMNQRMGMNSTGKGKGVNNPGLTVVTKSLTQPTVAILNKQSSTAKPTVRVNPGIAGGIGASGLTRIISANSGSIGRSMISSNLSSSQSLSALPPVTPNSTPPVLSLASNPLKRKEREDDDYDDL